MNNEDEWIKTFLEPLRLESSEAFVQQVMRKVRAYTEREEWIRWPVFARWAFPALALSIAGFTVALGYTLQPVQPSTTSVLLGGQEQSFSNDWLNAVEEQ
jgi:hypothetical protein